MFVDARSLRVFLCFYLQIPCQACRKLTKETQTVFAGPICPHVLQLSINNIWRRLLLLIIPQMLQLISRVTILGQSSSKLQLTLSGDRSELIVFSANIIRSDFRHRFANLIHMTGSSSGFKTSALTCKIRCQVSTSGWQPCSLVACELTHSRHVWRLAPFHPRLPHCLLPFWLVSVLLVHYNLLEFRQHLRADQSAVQH